MIAVWAHEANRPKAGDEIWVVVERSLRDGSGAAATYSVAVPLCVREFMGRGCSARCAVTGDNFFIRSSEICTKEQAMALAERENANREKGVSDD